MKSNGSVFAYLFKPFRFIAGKESLFIGLAVLALLFVLGYWSNTHFNGVLDAHYVCLTKQDQAWVHAVYQLVAWFSLVMVLYPMGRIFSSSSVRFIDMAGTLAMARFPLFLLALWGFNPDVHPCMEGINPFDTEAVMSILGDKVGLLVWTGLFSIAVVIWYIVVLYNAYSVSSNLKGPRGGWSFATGLIISEIISIVLLIYIL
ncbi:hypothetical protein FACS1894155_01110 [Bacteroidia bacterium]|nr:hypothetical protein FACS189455_2420 [Bacteroidia bacterium]GHU87678.1 hypothetical protein FACS1894155_01110 [Bacteroidia bacterium]